MVGAKFERLFGGPARRPESPLTQREMDIAASIQAVTEEIMLRAAGHAHRLTGMKNLTLAGGVALNCVGNGRILREGPFENIWIQPAAGDAGGALGAALFTDEQVRRYLDSVGAAYHAFDEEAQLVDKVADLISEGKVVGWFHGRMEFGPRALGSRSIIGDARSEAMQSIMNRKIKFRESFRPFAPCVLREKVQDYFDMDSQQDSPYMLLVAPLKEGRRLPSQTQHESLKGLDKLKVKRSVVPAVTHVDYSARVQTVDAGRHPRLHRLMKRFDDKTGCPVIINTSFNVRGEPIVCSPKDAYRCFMATDMDVLVMEDRLLYKTEQPEAGPHDIDEYKGQFELE